MDKLLAPDCLLKREACARALEEAGFPVSSKSLSTWASRGGGPEYQKFGRHVLYRWGTCLAWAEKRLTSPRRNSSESDLQSPKHN